MVVALSQLRWSCNGPVPTTLVNEHMTMDTKVGGIGPKNIPFMEEKDRFDGRYIFFRKRKAKDVNAKLL